MYFKVYFQFLPSMVIKKTKEGIAKTEFKLHFTLKLFEIGTLKELAKQNKLKLNTNMQHRTYLPIQLNYATTLTSIQDIGCNHILER